MNCQRLILSFGLVVLLGITAHAQIAPQGFQGIFGDGEAIPLEFSAGFTSGKTVDFGISASFEDLLVDLDGFATDGDSVSISDLILHGIDDCTGTAVYTWDSASLIQVVAMPQLSIGAGVITGELTLQPGSDLATATEPIILPQSLSATLTYNGLIVTSDNAKATASTLAFPSASITAVAIPEPSTIVSLLAGLGTLLVWRRK